MKKHQFFTLAIIGLALFASDVSAKRISMCRFKNTYKPKAAYSGYGKKSTVNGKIKTKPVRGYFKPSNGYKFVNPYARSK